ncbi:hypothetical protein K144316041_22270 [Clostridium tetani]|uniref:Uncharacterized protein n=1 Tax=Clostridium tetani TaxID=1513 RepID=A0A4Q0VDC1_CLOTA|nr:hypothetical protein [Clostridium tetani]AVP53934.1 hypothetical protein C3B72_01895 [Clostridium tetani]RXI48980.1 hypothetical protein DP130_06085 [Clostridium tetani]RXI53642.1 hypothetical protein DP122_07365 [Clostridium tetani]RXI55644.1 hypothetical protein DP124_01865 [Clostridium tetani]RXM57449.1 hypothetical protein DP133_10110 [Clostridium tetani]
MKKVLVLSENEILENYLSEILSKLNIYLDYIDFENYSGEKISYLIIDRIEEVKFSEFHCDYCLINMDEFQSNSLNICGDLITLGFGNKNTVTLSSVEENNEGFLYCLQRKIVNNKNEEIQPQEIPINKQFKNRLELYTFMCVFTIGLLENIESRKLKEILEK